MMRWMRSTLARATASVLCLALLSATVPSCGSGAPPVDGNNGNANGGNNNGGSGNGGVGTPTVTTVDERSAYATSTTGNALGASVVPGGAYTGGFSLIVTARDADEMGMLAVGPLAGAANGDLTGVTVIVKNPSGAEVARLGDGSVRYAAGLTSIPEPAAAVTTGLDDFLTNTVGVDPTADPDTNVQKLVDYWANGDNEPPSDAVETGLTAYVGALKAASNAVGPDVDGATRPTAVVLNPAVGTWTVEVTSADAAAAYGVTGLYSQSRSRIADMIGMQNALPNVEPASVRVGKDDPECQKVLDSFAIDMLSFLPLELAGVANPGLPGLVSWIIGIGVGVFFIEAAGAGAVGFVFGLAFSYLLGKTIDYAFQQGGHQDTWGDAFKMGLSSLVDRDPAGLSLNVFFPPGPYNPKTQVLYTGPSREFTVRRLFVNHCGALALGFSFPGTTTWKLHDGSGGATTMGSVIETESSSGSYLKVRTAARGESVAAGNFYIEARHRIAADQPEMVSTVRVIYDTNPLIFP
ncbi:MAG TPA: hypothetical protein PLD23_06255 [Armatimonadota bacterium]|nr:hypothetical protein [Armatimonadota bacterium]HQK93086.1 hypothetical protein [Armatimonadota bacterium]